MLLFSRGVFHMVSVFASCVLCMDIFMNTHIYIYIYISIDMYLYACVYTHVEFEWLSDWATSLIWLLYVPTNQL